MFKFFFWIFREREIYNSLREGFVYRFNSIKVFQNLWPEKENRINVRFFLLVKSAAAHECACKCMCGTGHLLCNIYSFNRPGSSLKEGKGRNRKYERRGGEGDRGGRWARRSESDRERARARKRESYLIFDYH